jgi:hypothetical protein
VNCVPVFIGREPYWQERFREQGLPIVGDDIKSQVGATIVHRTLARLLADRGVALDATYQLNTGGNTDFLNMLEQERLISKRVSKTESVQSQLDVRLAPEQIHIGPSDYVAWQKDNKVCFIRMEWNGFGDVPMNLELRLSVEDSPNSAGVAIDAIRCAKLALDRGQGGRWRRSRPWREDLPLQMRRRRRAPLEADPLRVALSCSGRFSQVGSRRVYFGQRQGRVEVDLGLKGLRAVVTGASRGIGLDRGVSGERRRDPRSALAAPKASRRRIRSSRRHA